MWKCLHLVLFSNKACIGEVISDSSIFLKLCYAQVVASTTFTVKFDSLKSDRRYRFWLAARNPSGWGADGVKVNSIISIISIGVKVKSMSRIEDRWREGKKYNQQ